MLGLDTAELMAVLREADPLSDAGPSGGCCIVHRFGAEGTHFVQAPRLRTGSSDSQNSQNDAIANRSRSGGRTLQNRCKSRD